MSKSMRSTRTPALLTLAALLLVAADKGADPVRGIWLPTSQTLNGLRVPDDRTSGATLTAYDGKSFVQRHGIEIVEEGTYTVDPTQSPATIDLVIEKGQDAGKRQLGIFKVDGDSTLTVCLAAPGA